MPRYPANGPSMSGVKPFRVYSGARYARPREDSAQVWDWVRAGDNLKKWKKKQSDKLKRKPQGKVLKGSVIKLLKWRSKN